MSLSFPFVDLMCAPVASKCCGEVSIYSSSGQELRIANGSGQISEAIPVTRGKRKFISERDVAVVQKACESSFNSERQTLIPKGVDRLVGEIVKGKWHKVFFSETIGLGFDDDFYKDLCVKMTEDSVNSVFSIEGTLSDGDKEKIARTFLKLFMFPTGRELMRDIVIMHHTCPNLARIRFKLGAAGIVWPYGLAYCDVFLDFPDSRSFLMPVARRSSTEKLSLDWCTCEVPAVLTLAHELGHYVDKVSTQLESLRLKWDERKYDRVMKEAARASGDCANAKILRGMEELAPEVDYYSAKARAGVILRDLLGLDWDNPGSFSKAKKVFFELWNTNNPFVEFINVLPMKTMEKKDHQHETYSDGRAMAELLSITSFRDEDHPKFSQSTIKVKQNTQSVAQTGQSEEFTESHADIQYDGLYSDSFVRCFYGRGCHQDDERELRLAMCRLSDDDQEEFNNLILKLLGKIYIRKDEVNRPLELEDLPRLV